MNLGQLIDPEWAQAGSPQRFKPMPRPELVEAAQRAERDRRVQADVDEQRELEARQRVAEIVEQRKAEAERARKKRQEEATVAAQEAESRRLALPPEAMAVKVKGARPISQLTILSVLNRSTVKLGSGAVARGAKIDVTHAASHLKHMFDLGLVERAGEARMYRYSVSKKGREKLALYGLYT